MPIPPFQQTMLPALKAIKDITPTQEIIKKVSEYFNLTQEEKDTLLPSRTQKIIDNRVNWALSYMFKAGLVIRVGRGKYSLTELGKIELAKNPKEISTEYLMNFEAFRKFKELRHSNTEDNIIEKSSLVEQNINPQEILEKSYQDLKTEVIDELLNIIRKLDPTDFEKLVMNLLKKMGYGADDLESVVHTGKTGDGGIDGEISQDRLGLDMIYVQAKRYAEDNAVGRPAIQQFVGSLNERKAKKGIFITSSYFAPSVKESVDKMDVKVILIDGAKLAELMYEYNLGVETLQIFEIKKVNTDFFSE